MIENLTMQSEEIEEVAKFPESPSSEKMTFTSCATLKEQEILPRTDQTSVCDSIKFDNINLEDDIEKVEVDSYESSSDSEHLILEDKPEFVPIPDFSAIPEENSSESIKNWLQKISEIQNVAIKKPVVTPQNPTASRVVNYQDLPYMGEITLDNSKPRRGRKPKKADICHLIYKNYGTIFPGTPNADSYLEKDNNSVNKKSAATNKDSDTNRNDVQNKIIGSLLEKRLTEENEKSAKVRANKNRSEPLNLCIRDLNELKIRLMSNNDRAIIPEIKSEPQSDDDIEIVNETPSASLGAKTDMRFPCSTPDSIAPSSPDTPNIPDSPGGTGSCVYFPNAGIFLQPMALQQQIMMYQRLAGNMNYALPSHSPRPPPSPIQSKLESPEHLRKIVPKLSKYNPSSETSHRYYGESKPKRNASTASSDKTPAKRKRSAIFIPPIPSENTTNPATEVSICKFKFTGGAKPSLQEKKMLSVDSGGNFRYYSGTGDKSMRGYEFFPRETLQQQINVQGSSTGAFLQASGEKIYPAPPLDITGGTSTSDFLLQPDLPGSSIAAIQQEVNHSSAVRNKKRKTRKSVQREKLEQTFKEKGFLIQTEQLESAEGATYCKFRQLRKFTRYLFRSWKDYLPGNIKELSESEQRELQEAGISAMAPDSIDNLTIKAEANNPS